MTHAPDLCLRVAPSGADNMESDLIKKMHKAIAIIRFKLEGDSSLRSGLSMA